VSAFEDLAESSQRDRDRAHELLSYAQSDREAAERKATEIVEAAHVRAAELHEASRVDRREADDLLKQAEADRRETERRSAEIVEAARAEAAVLNEESRRDREHASGQVEEARQKTELLVEEARQQVGWFVDEVEAAAAEGVAVAMNGTRPHLDEIRRDLDDLEDQRRSVLGVLSGLRESLDGLTSETRVG
jgi:F0F1-type ATP synthase membrane subunit b/b'